MFRDGAPGPTAEIVRCEAIPGNGEVEIRYAARIACTDGRTYYANFFGWWLAPGGRVHAVEPRDLPYELPGGCTYKDDPRNIPSEVGDAT